MNMKRLIVQPRQFGANYGYTWQTDDEEAAGLAQVEAHHDYCQLYSDDYSIRLLDPGRNSLSSPGVFNVDDAGNQTDETAPALPVRWKLHGVKGAIYFRFDGSDQGLGEWRDAEGHLLDVAPIDAWNALTGTPLGFNAEPSSLAHQAYDRNPAFHLPLFITMYRGTYKQIDTNSGWEIDSGPTDDPDVLLGLDTTNPATLESSRFDWWDCEMVKLPRRHITNVTDTQTDGDDGRVITFHEIPTSGSWLKYPINLTANKIVGPDQVLWLHIKTGCIRLPCVHLPFEGSQKALGCIYYQGHRFSISVQASMLVTPSLKL